MDRAGWITDVCRPDQSEYSEACKDASASGRLVRSDTGTLIVPGMVDLHIHAPQWPQIGQALHLPLEEWLYRYTFPLEARYSDTRFAKQI